MTMFIVQSAILFAIAYLLGCVLGWLLRHFFGVQEVETVATETATPAPQVKPKPESKVVKETKVAKPEPVPAAAPQPVAAKAEIAKPAPAPKQTEPVAKDNLKRIRGIGPQNEGRLNGIGVTTFAQIAAWGVDEQREIGERLSFPGRIEREEWVAQAKILAEGGETDFAKRVDEGGVESSTGSAAPDSEMGAKPPVLNSMPEAGTDDLTMIDGVGAALEKKLNAIGVYRFEQIAQWTAEHQVWIGNELGFRGRPERENWVEEAKRLVAGEAPTSAPKPKRGIIGAKKKT